MSDMHITTNHDVLMAAHDEIDSITLTMLEWKRRAEAAEKVVDAAQSASAHLPDDYPRRDKPWSRSLGILEEALAAHDQETK